MSPLASWNYHGSEFYFLNPFHLPSLFKPLQARGNQGKHKHIPERDRHVSREYMSNVNSLVEQEKEPGRSTLQRPPSSSSFLKVRTSRDTHGCRRVGCPGRRRHLFLNSSHASPLCASHPPTDPTTPPHHPFPPLSHIGRPRPATAITPLMLCKPSLPCSSLAV